MAERKLHWMGNGSRNGGEIVKGYPILSGYMGCLYGVYFLFAIEDEYREVYRELTEKGN